MSNSNQEESLTGLLAAGESSAVGIIGAATPAEGVAAASCSPASPPLDITVGDTFDGGGLAAVSASDTAVAATAACGLTTLSPVVVAVDFSSGMVILLLVLQGILLILQRA